MNFFGLPIYLADGKVRFANYFRQVCSIFSVINKKETAPIKVVDKVIDSFAWLLCYSYDAYPCEGTVATTVNRVMIAFTIEYTYGCNIPYCKKKLLEKIQEKIAILNKNISLTVIFADGKKLTLDLFYCTLIPTNSSEYISFTKAKQTFAIDLSLNQEHWGET